jgi:hypothetical protein
VVHLRRTFAPETPSPIVGIFGTFFNYQSSRALYAERREPHGETETSATTTENDEIVVSRTPERRDPFDYRGAISKTDGID